MTTALRIGLLLSAIALLFIVLMVIKKGHLSIRYSLVWFLLSFVLLIIAIFPGIMDGLASFFGFEITSNLVFVFVIALLMLIVLSLSIIVTTQKRELIKLNQEMSLIKMKMEDK